ncbi:MAG: ParA family protein [Candidatus Aminicenantes bacterium]|nr:MAG: ParA family protein [Candidatus Aminicenantes bacterium]
MGKIIAIASQKGGVGKTTTVLNLGHSLTRFGSRVMLVDCDPQGGMSIASNLAQQTNLGLLNLLKNTAKAEDIIFSTRDKTMGVVGLGSLQPEDVLLLENEARSGTFGMLVQSLTKDYDYVILDSPSGVGGLPASLLSISSSVIITINCRVISLKTIPLFLKLIKEIKSKYNPKLELEGVVITMYDEKKPLEKQVLGEIKKAFPPHVFFRTIIPYSEHYEMANLHSVPAALMPNALEAARPYFEMAMELKEKETIAKTGGKGDEEIMGLF